MIARTIGYGFATARDFIARGLVKIGVTPNMLSLAGLVLTCGAGVCLAIGAGGGFAWRFDPSSRDGAYLLLAGALIILSSACDMLDGAVARLGDMSTPFGAFLDSTLDRFSDFVVYAGLAAAYAWSRPANVTFILLAMLAFANSVMISYTRARAEDLIKSCSVGFWQRGERSAAILIAIFAHNIPALLLQQAFLTMATVYRRISHTRAVLAGKTIISDPRQGSLSLKVRLWRWPRGTIGYEITVGINIAWLIFARVPATDWLRNLLS